MLHMVTPIKVIFCVTILSIIYLVIEVGHMLQGEMKPGQPLLVATGGEGAFRVYRHLVARRRDHPPPPPHTHTLKVFSMLSLVANF